MMTKTIVGMLLVMAPILGSAQGICVFDKMTLSDIRGKVTDVDNIPLAEATIGLYKSRYGNLIGLQKVTTDERGRFIFSKVPPGEYTVVAHYKSMVPLQVPITVSEADKIKNSPQRLLIVLDFFVDKPCGGGSAKIVDRN